GGAVLDISIGSVDRLHAGAAVDLHREGRHGLAHAEPQRRDAGRVHLVGDHVDAAEDHLVEGVGGKRLAQQQRPAALDRKVDRREGAGPSACLEERRAAAVDDEDRPRRHSAAFDWNEGVVGDGTSPWAGTARWVSSSAAKSSTAITSATASCTALS